VETNIVNCGICGEHPVTGYCHYCGRASCDQCRPHQYEPCRGCFELDDAVDAAAQPDRPKSQPPVTAHAKSVCVDLDGVLAAYDRWHGIEHIGEPLAGAVDFTRQLRSLGVKVVIHTTRVNPDPAGMLQRRVQEWLDKNGFTYDEIYAGQGKPLACAYVDDRAVLCEPQRSRLAYLRAFTAVADLIARQNAAGDTPKLGSSPVVDSN
jgi:hypothetical protein